MLKTLLAALVPAALLAAPAVAAPAEIEITTTQVGFADLDLSRADHQDVLARRLTRAAQSVCERPFIRDLPAMLAYERCMSSALAAAHDRLAGMRTPAAQTLAAR